MARLFPASDPRNPASFASLDALAAHLLRQRPGRRIELLPQVASMGDDDFPVLMVVAIRPADARAFADDWTAFGRDGIGWTADGLAADPDAMAAAFARVRSAGGMAA